MTNRMFAVMTAAKLSCLKHNFRSVKKGNLNVKKYISKIQNLCTLIEASGHQISESERVEVVLEGLCTDYDAVVTLASFSMEPLPLCRLVDILLEYKSRQQ